MGIAIILVVCIGVSMLMNQYRDYNKNDHVHYNKSKLREDAKIIDVNTKTVGLKGEKVYETKVAFDDGFEYVSHKTLVDKQFITSVITLTKEMKEQIVKEAIEEHIKALNE